MNDYKKPTPLTVNNIKVLADLQLVIEDIIKAHQENRIISIQGTDPELAFRPEEEQRILIRILNKK